MSSAARNVGAFWQLHSRCATWQRLSNFAMSSFTFSSELFTPGFRGGSWPRISTKGHQASSVLWKMSASLKRMREAGLEWLVVHLHHIQPPEPDKHLDEILTPTFKVSYAVSVAQGAHGTGCLIINCTGLLTCSVSNPTHLISDRKINKKSLHLRPHPRQINFSLLPTSRLWNASAQNRFAHML